MLNFSLSSCPSGCRRKGRGGGMQILPPWIGEPFIIVGIIHRYTVHGIHAYSSFLLFYFCCGRCHSYVYFLFPSSSPIALEGLPALKSRFSRDSKGCNRTCKQSCTCASFKLIFLNKVSALSCSNLSFWTVLKGSPTIQHMTVTWQSTFLVQVIRS